MSTKAVRRAGLLNNHKSHGVIFVDIKFIFSSILHAKIQEIQMITINWQSELKGPEGRVLGQGMAATFDAPVFRLGHVFVVATSFSTPAATRAVYAIFDGHTVQANGRNFNIG